MISIGREPQSHSIEIVTIEQISDTCCISSLAVLVPSSADIQANMLGRNQIRRRAARRQEVRDKIQEDSSDQSAWKRAWRRLFHVVGNRGPRGGGKKDRKIVKNIGGFVAGMMGKRSRERPPDVRHSHHGQPPVQTPVPISEQSVPTRRSWA